MVNKRLELGEVERKMRKRLQVKRWAENNKQKHGAVQRAIAAEKKRIYRSNNPLYRENENKKRNGKYISIALKHKKQVAEKKGKILAKKAIFRT